MSVIAYTNSARQQKLGTPVRRSIANAKTSKDIYVVLNHLLHRKGEHPTSAHSNIKELVDKFITFYSDKIATIRRTFVLVPTVDAEVRGSQQYVVECQLHAFRPTSESEINTLVLISSLSPKSCALDPIPSWLVKQCPSIIPALTDMVIHSSSSGIIHIPPSLKHAIYSYICGQEGVIKS